MLQTVQLRKIPDKRKEFVQSTGEGWGEPLQDNRNNEWVKNMGWMIQLIQTKVADFLEATAKSTTVDGIGD